MSALVARLRRDPWPAAAIAIALAVVLVGKRAYADAGADDLGFVLGPTAWLVSWIGGYDFRFEAGAGYVDPAARFIIAPVCAGIGFFLAGFLALVVDGVVDRVTGRDAAAPRWTSAETARRLAAAAAVAALATPLVNAARILGALALRGREAPLGLDGGELHRLEGTVVYLTAILALCAIGRRLRRRARGPVHPATLAVPVAVYLFVALGLPFLNGAAARPGFATHAAWVVGVAAAVAAVAVAAGGIARRGGHFHAGREGRPAGESIRALAR